MTLNSPKYESPRSAGCDTAPRLTTSRYESIIQSVNGIVWEADADPFRFTFVNGKAESILGYPIEQWLADPQFWTKHLHPADRERAVSFCEASSKRREDHELEYRMIAADGRVIWFRDHITFSAGDDGVARLCGLMIEISDRMDAIEEIRSSEAQMRLLLDQVPATVWLTDRDLIFTHVAGDVRRTHADITGTSLVDFFQTRDPELVPIAAHQKALLGEPQFYEFNFCNRDFEARVEPLRNCVGEVVGCIGVAHDVTERKVIAENILKEKQFTEALLDSLPGAFIQYDLSGKRLRWNKYIEETSGYTTEELHEMPLFSNVVDEKRPELQKVFRDLFVGGKATFEFEIAMKDSSIRPYFVTSRRVEIGGQKSIIGIGIDVAELKEAEAALRKNREELVEAQRIGKIGNWTWEIATNEVTWSEELYRRRKIDPNTPAPSLEEQKLFHTPESWARLSTAVEEAVANGTSYEVETELLLPDYGRGWFICRGEAIRNENGNIVKLRGTEHDITDRKLTDEKLRLSEERFSKAFNANPDPISIQRHEDGSVITVNDRWIEVYGFSRDEAINLTWQRRKQTRPEDREVLKNLLEEHGSVREHHIEIRTKAGDVRYVSLSSEQIVLDNQLCNIFLHRDITEQRFAEESLRESERRYRETLTNLKMIGVATDTAGKIAFCNDFMLELTGWDRGSVIGSLWSDIFLPDGMVNMPGEPGEFSPEALLAPHFENEIQTRGGELRSVRWTNTALRDVEGRVIGVASLGDDITERKNAEEALRLSEQRYRKIVETAPEGIVVMDLATGKFVDFNLEALALFNLSADEIVDRGPTDMCPEFQPDGRRSDEAILGNVRRALAGEIPVFEWTHCDSNGTPFPCEVRLLQLPDESRQLIRGTITDITEHKRIEQAIRTSEERYRDLVENSIDVIYTHDLEGNFTSINKAAEQITGYSRDEAIKLNIADVTAPEFLETVKETIANTVAGNGDGVLSIEVLTKAGQRRAVEITYGLVINHGVPVGIQGTARDVTAHLQLEQKLRQAQRLESIGRLAGGIAHDFNNMLQAINGYSELVLRELPASDRLRPFVQEIKNAGERSASLTQQLLAFSRKQIMQPRVIDVNSVVSGLGKMLRRLIGEDVILKTDLSRSPGSVLADPSQLEQVIVNLVVNARDAMPNGGRLLIETNRVDLDPESAANHLSSRPGSYVVISVTDNGVGIEDEVRQHIFEPFYTTREIGKGTGLGLATVYGIVQQSDGFVELDTEPDRGSTFKIYLPHVEQEPEEYVSSLDDSPSFRGSETLLLIEDEEVVRSVINELLRSNGYKVFVAATPAEAISICREYDGHIDLVVADVIMPEMSGPEVVKALLELRPEMKVLYLSGYADTALAHHGILDSDINFLQKPFTHEAIAAKLRQVLGEP